MSSQLLDAFGRRAWVTLGRKSFNGAPWGAAQNLALGMIKHLQTHLRCAARRRYTSLSMNGKMAPAMKVVDDYLEAVGRDRAEKVSSTRR